MEHESRCVTVLQAAAVAVLLTACAATSERPTAEMARAQALIEQAEKQGAPEFAPADLERARDKLHRADVAANDGDTEGAQRMAAEASLDAEFATAKAAQGKALKAAEETDRSIEALQEEAARSDEPPSGT